MTHKTITTSKTWPPASPARRPQKKRRTGWRAKTVIATTFIIPIFMYLITSVAAKEVPATPTSPESDPTTTLKAKVAITSKSSPVEEELNTDKENQLAQVARLLNEPVSGIAGQQSLREAASAGESEHARQQVDLRPESKDSNFPATSGRKLDEFRVSTPEVVILREQNTDSNPSTSSMMPPADAPSEATMSPVTVPAGRQRHELELEQAAESNMEAQVLADKSASKEKRGSQSAKQTSGQQIEFNPEILRDHEHESDKLHHHNQRVSATDSGDGPKSPRFSLTKGGTQPAPKLEMSGWLPSPVIQDEAKKRGPEVVGHTERVYRSREAAVRRQKPRINRQQQVRQRPKPTKLLSMAEVAPSVEWPEGFVLGQQSESSFQSSLRPKHVPPPTSSQQEFISDPDYLNLANLWRPIENGERQNEQPILPAARLIIKSPNQLEQAKGSSEHRRPALVGSLKVKSFGLLPRLAAKLLRTDKSALPEETLNQQHSFQFASHNSPQTPHFRQQPSTSAGKVSAGKVFPPSGGKKLVKSLFARDPNSKPSLLLPTLSSRNKAAQQTNPSATRSSTPQTLSTTDASPMRMMTRLVLVNGQVYSVLAPPTKDGQVQEGSILGGAFFDHQTSDTSDFPIFEAMGATSGLDTSDSVQNTYLPTRESHPRCDRPHHIIQADRVVVEHILQSQQNFVIARVPIKKYVRPEATQAARPMYPAPSNAPTMSASPQVAFAAASGPPASNYQIPMSPYVPSYASTDRFPIYHSPTIEVSASVPRNSVWQSLANLLSSIRGSHRQPSMAASNMQQASYLQSGSHPASMFIDGPLIFTTSANRRLGRRPSLSQLTRVGRDKPEAWPVGGRAQTYPVAEEQSSDPINLIHDHAAYAASMVSGQLLDPLLASASAPGQLDPMRRLLMLKTSTESEVCSPVGQVGMKVKYSCVPNYCVAAALASSSNWQQQPSYSHQGGIPNFHVVNSNAIYKASNSMQQDYRDQRPAWQNNQTQKPANDHVEVQQFDDRPPSLSPIVTYTHLNAYNPPTVSRLAQPQHQQYVTTTQALDAFAYQDPDDRSIAPPPLSIYRPQGQASSLPVDPITGQLTYVPFPGSIGTTTPRPTTSSIQRPSLTFGTAYIRTSPVPTNWQGGERGQGSRKTSHRWPGGEHKTTRSKSFSQSDNYGSTMSSVGEPGEFLSQVDEQLEKPIRVEDYQMRRPRPAANQRRRQPWHSPEYNHYQLDQKAPTTEKGGSGAENSLVESPPRLRPSSRFRAASYRGRTRPPQYLSHSNHLEGAEPDGDYDDEDDSSYAGPDDDQPMNFDEGGGSQHFGVQPNHMPAYQPEGAAAFNLSRTIPVVDGRVQPQPEPRERRRTRNHNPLTQPTSEPFRGYGQRQSTPLPPPEKNDESDPQADANNDDDSNSSSYPSVEPARGTTDCDCNKPTSENTSTDDDSEYRQPTGVPAKSTRAPVPSKALEVRRVPATSTTLRPHNVGRKSSPTKMSQQRVYGDPSMPSLAPDHQYAKDRRQTQPTPPAGGPILRFSTKRPYNLRNTSYKNLQAGLQQQQQVFSPASSTEPSLNQLPPQRPRADITTTAASLPSWPLDDSVDENRTNNSHSAISVGNNHTHFDETGPSDPLIEHQVGHFSHFGAQTSNLLPQSAAAAEGPKDDQTLAHHELLHHDHLDDDRLVGRKHQPDRHNATTPPPIVGGRAVVSAANNWNRTALEQLRDDSIGSTFRPDSVNEIVAQARRESGNRMPADDSNSYQASANIQSAPSSNITSTMNNSTSHSSESSSPREAMIDTNENGGSDDNDVTPHQYQIQLRWNNSSSVDSMRSPSEGQAKNLKGAQEGEQAHQSDQMEEKVRDRLFEHREDEHWHSKIRRRVSKRRKLIGGKWVVLDGNAAEPLVIAGQLDYGPHAHLRETPIKGQLPNEPTDAQSERHFAIPTPNFRQSPQFVEWVQREVNLNEEPGEPVKVANRTQITSSHSTD